jgi:hypothetical protein
MHMTVSQGCDIENLPPHSTWPSSQDGCDAKPKLQSKNSQRKSKSKQSLAKGIVALPDVSGVCGAAEGAEPAVSVISALQEFIQDSKTFRMPTRHSILQWRFEERSSKSNSSEPNSFRATAAFVLEGVPHHVAGDWKASKNVAKRDAAERSLELFVGRWGLQLLQDDHMGIVEPTLNLHESGDSLEDSKADKQEDVGEVATLVDFCMQFPPCGQTLPQLSIVREDGSCKAYAEIHLFGVPHTFAGSACEDEDMAHDDVARRVLWYLQCPGFDNDFEVDMEALAADSHVIAPPPLEWTADGNINSPE